MAFRRVVSNGNSRREVSTGNEGPSLEIKRCFSNILNASIEKKLYKLNAVYLDLNQLVLLCSCSVKCEMFCVLLAGI